MTYYFVGFWGRGYDLLRASLALFSLSEHPVCIKGLLLVFLVAEFISMKKYTLSVL